MKQTRDFVYIKTQPVRHDTATRDYLCGTCGGGLVTRYVEAAWQTLCARDPSHTPDAFVKKTAWQAIQARRAVEAETAREIFSNLPADLQAAIANY